jgi:hypothetical protein
VLDATGLGTGRINCIYMIRKVLSIFSGELTTNLTVLIAIKLVGVAVSGKLNAHHISNTGQISICPAITAELTVPKLDVTDFGTSRSLSVNVSNGVFSLGIGFLHAVHTYVVALVEVLVLSKRKLNVHHIGEITVLVLAVTTVLAVAVLNVTVLGTGRSLSLNLDHIALCFHVGEIPTLVTHHRTKIIILVRAVTFNVGIICPTYLANAGIAIRGVSVAESLCNYLVTNAANGSLCTSSIIGRLVTKSVSLLLSASLTNGIFSTGRCGSIMTKSLYENVITKLTGLSSCTGSSRAKLVADRSDGGLCYGDKTAIGALYALGLTLGGASGLNSCNGSKIVTLCCSFVGILVTASTSESNLTLLGTSSLFGNELSVFVNVSRLRLRARCNCKYDCKEHKHASQNGNLSLHDKEPPFLFFISFEIT